MGGLSSSLGFAGGAAGSGYSAPQMANVVNPVTSAMTDQAYKDSQTGLTNQANFLQALQAQNGIGNQSSVFNQLQNTANGTGANPAQAQLAQSTAQNVANQSALMAGQRGSSANTGLMARQIANQGANTQQQAAGQAATLQANQSLNALNSMGQLATNQVGQQANATNSYSSAAQGEQSNLYNMLGGVNSSNVSSQGSLNSANAALIGQSVNNQNGYIGQMSGGGASGLTSMFADGGEVGGGQEDAKAPEAPLTAAPPPQADPMTADVAPQQVSTDPNSGPQSSFAQAIQGIQSGNPGTYGGTQAVAGPAEATTASITANPITAGSTSGNSSGGKSGGGGSGLGSLMALMAHGGKVPALVSPGEQYLPPQDVKKVAKDGKNPLSVGERIPGKPKVPGNSYANDTVHKKLEPGGVVIPNSVMQSSDPAGNAAKFIQATLAKSSMKSKAKK